VSVLKASWLYFGMRADVICAACTWVGTSDGIATCDIIVANRANYQLSNNVRIGGDYLQFPKFC